MMVISTRTSQYLSREIVPWKEELDKRYFNTKIQILFLKSWNISSKLLKLWINFPNLIIFYCNLKHDLSYNRLMQKISSNSKNNTFLLSSSFYPKFPPRGKYYPFFWTCQGFPDHQQNLVFWNIIRTFRKLLEDSTMSFES